MARPRISDIQVRKWVFVMLGVCWLLLIYAFRLLLFWTVSWACVPFLSSSSSNGLERHIYIISTPEFLFAGIQRFLLYGGEFSSQHSSHCFRLWSPWVNKRWLDSLILSTTLPPASFIFFTGTMFMTVICAPTMNTTASTTTIPLILQAAAGSMAELWWLQLCSEHSPWKHNELFILRSLLFLCLCVYIVSAWSLADVGKRRYTNELI